MEVAGIRLFLFGGVTETKLRTERPADEFAITAVGPATSFALAGALWGTAIAVGDLDGNPVAGAIGYLGWLNLVLGVFNLVPGLPLDGGRILHSAVWRATGDVDRATRIAAGAGQAVGYGLIAVGIVALFAGGVGGLWFAAIGWFLAQAARAEDEQRRMGRALQGATAADVMTADPEEGRRTPREERSTHTEREAATPLTDIATVAPNEPMDRVFECLVDEEVNRVLVVDDDRVIGIITPTDIARWAHRREQLGSN